MRRLFTLAVLALVCAPEALAAYAFTATTRDVIAGDRRFKIVTITETECAAGTEWSVDTGWEIIKVHQFKLDETSGTATTYAPIIGNAAGPAGSTLWGSYAAAASHNVADTFVMPTSNGTIYGQCTPDAGTDNAVTTQIIIEKGA